MTSFVPSAGAQAEPPVAPPTSSPPRRKRRSRGIRTTRTQQWISGWTFIALPVVLFLVFFIIPIGAAAYLSLTDYSIIGEFSWVGIANYKAIFEDEFFWIAMRNTLYYTALYVPLGILTSLGTALLLNRNTRVARVFRTLFYIPVVSSSVATASIWIWLLNPQVGFINIALGKFGIDGPAWLESSTWAMPAIIIMSVWAGFGGNMVILLGGLQGVPGHLYEAARIDGASKWQQFRYVTMPGISKTMFLVTTLQIIGAFQVFDQAYIMTKGGPGNATVTIVYYIFDKGFGNLDMGYASAMSFVLFAIILVVSLINARVSNRSE